MKQGFIWAVTLTIISSTDKAPLERAKSLLRSGTIYRGQLVIRGVLASIADLLTAKREQALLALEALKLLEEAEMTKRLRK